MNRSDIYSVYNLVGLGDYCPEYEELIDKKMDLSYQIDEFEQGELDITYIEQRKSQLELLEELIDEITTSPLVYVKYD